VGFPVWENLIPQISLANRKSIFCLRRFSRFDSLVLINRRVCLLILTCLNHIVKASLCTCKVTSGTVQIFVMWLYVLQKPSFWIQSLTIFIVIWKYSLKNTLWLDYWKEKWNWKLKEYKCFWIKLQQKERLLTTAVLQRKNSSWRRRCDHVISFLTINTTLISYWHKTLKQQIVNWNRNFMSSLN
jgi:hypothetical protein